MAESPRQPGGFLPPTGGLPSPAPSSASSRAPSSLPHPRSKPLMPGGSKEDIIRRYAEQQLMLVSRRYVKKFSSPGPGDTVVGFNSFSEVCRELDDLVNILWQAGTPSLQVPFLLKLASDFTQYVRSFPPSPRASFDLLRKIDHCFASLLNGKDIDTDEPLPGFEKGLRAGLTTTDMVRCRSLVEQTRVLMVEIMSEGEVEEEEDEEDEDGGDEGDDWDIEMDSIHLDAAKVYENTITQLGIRMNDSLASGGIAA